LQVAVERTERKNQNKAKVLELLQQKGELSNEELCQALGVSRSSVVRYMDELESENRIEQVGDAGRGVTYRLKH
jgi:DNA-binding IclR family transcriptional regulator